MSEAANYHGKAQVEAHVEAHAEAHVILCLHVHFRVLKTIRCGITGMEDEALGGIDALALDIEDAVEHDDGGFPPNIPTMQIWDPPSSNIVSSNLAVTSMHNTYIGSY